VSKSSINDMLSNLMTGLAVAAIFFAWLIPNHYPPWLSFYNESCMAIGLLLLTGALYLRGIRPQLPAVAWFAVLAAAIPWLQWAGGLLPFSGDAWVASLYLLGLASAISVGFSWAGPRNTNLMLVLAAALLASATASSLMGIQQVLEGGVLGIWGIDGLPGMQAKGNLAQPNHLALALAIGLMSLLYLYERHVLGSFVSGLLLATLVVGLGLTRSRASLLFGCVLAIGIVVLAMRNRQSFRTPIAIVAAAVSGQWLVAYCWPFLQDAMLLSWHGSLVERGIQTSRYDAWWLFIGAIKEQPWSGYGWLQTSSAQFDVAERFAPLGEQFAQAHNIVLELLIWCGLPVGITIIGFGIYWGISRFLLISSLESLCAFLVIAVVGTHSLLEFPEQSAYFLIPVGLLIGLIEQSIHRRSYGSSRWGMAQFTCAALIFGLIGSQYLVVEEDFRLARFEYLKIGSMKAAKMAPDVPMLSNLAAYVKFYRMEPRVGMTDEELSEMRAVTRRYPYAKLLYGYSASLTLNGHPDDGRRIFALLRQLHGDRVYEVIKGDVLERAGSSQPGLKALLKE
jgi:O-antigen ligase